MSGGDAAVGVKGIAVPLGRGREHYVAYVLPLTSGKRRGLRAADTDLGFTRDRHARRVGAIATAASARMRLVRQNKRLLYALFY
jgi:hypothetical protein